MRSSFIGEKIDINRTIRDVEGDWDYWRRKKHRLVRSFNTDIQAFSNAIGHLLEDFVSIANCKDGDDVVAAAFAEPRKMQQEIEALFLQEVPIKVIFEQLLSHTRRIRDQLAKL